MTVNDSASNSPTSVLIELLDPNLERPVKSWSLDNRTTITIGRAEDQDIEISDGYVSRQHARLTLTGSGWELESLGRNGVLVDNRQVNHFPLGEEVKFRLGSGGPFLRFRVSAKKAESIHTICFDTFPAPLFALDEVKLKTEVTRIAEGDYFQTLQDKARSLRRQRSDA